MNDEVGLFLSSEASLDDSSYDRSLIGIPTDCFGDDCPAVMMFGLVYDDDILAVLLKNPEPERNVRIAHNFEDVRYLGNLNCTLEEESIEPNGIKLVWITHDSSLDSFSCIDGHDGSINSISVWVFP